MLVQRSTPAQVKDWTATAGGSEGVAHPEVGRVDGDDAFAVGCPANSPMLAKTVIGFE